MATPAVALTDVTVTFLTARRDVPPVTALHGLSLTVRPGMFMTVIGPSGCGKSALFGLLAGLITPISGSVTVHGQPVIGTPGQVGYMPQRDLLLPWRTVLQNVTLGPELARRCDMQAARACTEAAAALRPRRVRGCLPHRTLRRHAAARRAPAHGADGAGCPPAR